MNKISKIITTSIATANVLAARAFAIDVNSMENPAQAGADTARANGMPTKLVGTDGVFGQLTSTILYAVGIISVIMLILGGLKYVLSGGDQKKVSDAKNTIIYAIIGLIISVLAYAIVNFVISTIGTVSE